MKKLVSLCAVLFVSLVAAARGSQINSGSFSMGFGYTGNAANSYTQLETAGSNTPDPSPGLFNFTYTFVPRYVGGYQGGFSGDGPIFTGRTLLNGTPGSNHFSGWSPSFQFNLGGSYTGPMPVNMIPGTGKLQLNVDSIRIYAKAHSSYSSTPNDIRWTETTVLNPGDSPVLLLNSPPNGSTVTASDYQQLTWDPAEFVENALTSNRSFVINSLNSRVLDGFEIFGSATFLYDAIIPEPSSAVLLGSGVLGLFMQRRRRKNLARA